MKPNVRIGSYSAMAVVLAGEGWGLWTWRAQDDACDDCSDLDGEEYEAEDDVPDRPHPNCQCEIEYVIQEMHKKKWKKLHKARGNSRPKHLVKRPAPFTTKSGKKKR